MPITILSPYSGRPVKVRDQDLGRAIRDEEGRIFYVIPRSDGQGHYAAPTRKGSEKDEQRYLDLERKTAEQGEVAREVQQQPVHDATGPGRPVSPVRLLVLLLVILAAIAAGLWLLLDIDLTPLSPDEPVPVEPVEPAEPVQPTEPLDQPEPAEQPETRGYDEYELVYRFDRYMPADDALFTRASAIAGSLRDPGARAA